MFNALVNFIQYHINETLMAFFAPIIKHCAVDSYLVSFCFAILEFAEIYGVVTVAFLFGTLLFFYRNSLMNVFKFPVKFLGIDNNSRKMMVVELPKRLINYTRALSIKIHNRIYKTSSTIYVIIKKLLNK
jgi:hypothetical protein